MGRPDLRVTANTPLYAVFRTREGENLYMVYNASAVKKTVTFSDGKKLEAPPRQLTISKTARRVERAK